MGEQFGKCDRCQQVMYAGHKCSAMTTGTPRAESLQEIERLVLSFGVVCANGRREVGEYSSSFQALLSAITRVVQERDALAKELDEASPKRKCDRCGGEFRMHLLIYEEGDELECWPCNERENARERAAIATEKPHE